MRKMFITTVSVWVGESNGVGVDSLVTTTRHLWVILTYLLMYSQTSDCSCSRRWKWNYM